MKIIVRQFVLLFIGCILVFGMEKNDTVVVVRTDSMLQTGIQQYVIGRHREAINLLLQAEFNNASTNFYLGLSYFALNDLQNAGKFMKKSIALDSTNMSYRFQLAKILLQSGMSNSAEEELTYIVGQDSTFTQALFQLASINYDAHNYPTALKFLHKVITLNPRDYLSYYYIGTSHINLGQQDSAYEYFSSSITLNPNYLPAIQTLASLHYTKKNYYEACRLYTTCSKLKPNQADYVYKIGLCLLQVGEMDSSMDFFRRAVALDTLDDTYYSQLGYCYIKTKNYDSAITAYRNAIRISPDNPAYYTNLALSFSSIDSVEQADKAYRGAIIVSRPEQIAQLYIRLGTMYFYEKEYSQARSEYQRALDIIPDSKEAQFYLALTLDNLNTVSSAIKHYKKYYQLASQDTSQRERLEQAKSRIQVLQQKKK